MKAILSICAAALLVSLLASCGNGDDAETYSVRADFTVTTADIPKGQYIPRINRICRDAWPGILSGFARYMRRQDQSIPQRRRFTEAVRLHLTAGIVFHIFDGIYDLGAPPGEEQRVEEIIGTMQSASERAQMGLAPVASVRQVAALYDAYNRLARRYGFDECVVDEARLSELEP